MPPRWLARRFPKRAYRRKPSCTPVVRVTDCRDPTDDIYLALAADAGAIVSSDNDLLALAPWRGVRILTARQYLERVGAL